MECIQQVACSLASRKHLVTLIAVNILKNFLVEMDEELRLSEAWGLAQGHSALVGVVGGHGLKPSSDSRWGHRWGSHPNPMSTLSSWVVLSEREGNCSVMAFFISVRFLSHYLEPGFHLMDDVLVSCCCCTKLSQVRNLIQIYYCIS